MSNQPVYQRTYDLIERSLKEFGNYTQALSRTQEQIEDDEDIVEEAVRLKRMGRYDESCKIYLDLMRERKLASSEMLYFLFKPTACAGCFDLSMILLFNSFQILANYGYAQGSNQENWLMNMGYLAARIVNDSDIAAAQQVLTPISGNPNYKIPVDIDTLRAQIANMLSLEGFNPQLKAFLIEMIKTA